MLKKAKYLAILAIPMIFSGCDKNSEWGGGAVSSHPYRVWDFTLEDGTRCVAARSLAGGMGLQCDWR